MIASLQHPYHPNTCAALGKCKGSGIKGGFAMGLKKEDISGRRVAWLLLLEGCNKLKCVTKELRTFLPRMSVIFFPQKNWGGGDNSESIVRLDLLRWVTFLSAPYAPRSSALPGAGRCVSCMTNPQRPIPFFVTFTYHQIHQVSVQEHAYTHTRTHNIRNPLKCSCANAMIL